MSTVGLSHPRALTPIADPIHTRIELTIFDRNLVDTSIFQRLHFVLQNSVNYVSFPTNKNTRFPHSLGAAHTCGVLFSKGLSNAQTDCLKSFFEASSNFLENLFSIHAEAISGAKAKELSAEDVLKKCIRAHRATISGRSDFLHAPLNKTQSNDRVKHPDPFGAMAISAEFIADTLWQAVRIYALSHDLGHLPMSHAFESALSKSQSQRWS